LPSGFNRDFYFYFLANDQFILDHLSLQCLSQLLIPWHFQRLWESPKTNNFASRTLFSDTFSASISLGGEILFGLTVGPLFGAGEQLAFMAFDENDSCA
jgi:hypothetical protein